MKSYTVCDDPLYHGKDSAAHDGHVQEAGSSAAQGAEFRFSQTEDGGKHDGVEEPYGENGPHGSVPVQEHGGSDQRTGGNRANGKQVSRLESLQEWRADKASDHGASPVEGNISRRRFSGEGGDLGQTKIID